jgi:predicted DCC family thiol-disulfide oxidoreductase YuxK
MAAVTALRPLPATYTRWWAKPFAIFGADLPPNLVLMARLIVLALLLQQQLPLSSHFLPFFPFFDRMGSPVVFHRVLVLVFLAAAAALFVNWRVRAASIVLGLTIFVSILASRPAFSNNLAYCGALLFLIGLQPPDREPWTLRLQVVLLYFGAGLNKLLDPDWRSGQFFEYWFGHAHSHAWYLQIAGHMPPLLVSRLMSWASFCTELGLSVMLLFRRLYPVAIMVGLAFHTSMLVMTNTTFRMYYIAACVSYLAFVTWPKGPLMAAYDRECGFCTTAKRFYERIDLERRCRWISSPQLRESICLIVAEKRYNGFAALRMLLLYNPLTYFCLVVVLRSPDVLHLRRWIALAALLLLSPMADRFGERLFRLLAHDRYRFRTATSSRPV